MTPRPKRRTRKRFLFQPALAEICEHARAFAEDPSCPRHLRDHAFDVAATVRALGEIAFRFDKAPWTPRSR